MPSVADILRIGISGLDAYEQALNVSSQNIANANTPSYSRREVNFSESPFYSGVDVSSIQRIYSDSANQAVQTANSAFSRVNIMQQQITNFEPLFDDNTTSIGTYITSSLTALNQLNGNPALSNNRDLYLSALTQLSTRFQDVNNQLNTQVNLVNTNLQTEVGQVNNILNGLSDINTQIATIGNTDTSQLLDQREGLLEQLANYFNFTTSVDSNNLLNVTLSNGFGLLNNLNAPVQLTTITDPANPTNLLVAVKNGATTSPIDNYISSGQISGWLNYRDNIVEQSQRSLGRLALAFSQSLNAQNKLGIDANQNWGGNIFSDINNSSIITNRAIENLNNTGSGNVTVNITDVTKLTTSNYTLSIGSGNTYTLTRISDGTSINGSIGVLPQTITSADGFTINLNSGTFNAGDSYTISPTINAANNMTLAITSSAQLALGWPVATQTVKASQASDLTASVTSIIDPTNAALATTKQLSPPLKILFHVSGGVTTYDVINANTSVAIQSGIPYTAGNLFPTPAPTSYNPGYQVNVTGANIQDGDVINIQYSGNSSDNRNGEAIAALYSTGKLQNGNPTLDTFNQGYNAITSNIAVQGNSAQTQLNSATSIKQQANSARDSISGVSLEEEAMNLDKFQEAYQANAQVLTAARTILQTIVGMFR